MKSVNRIGAAASAVLLLAAFVAAISPPARADDFGPNGDIREVRFVAQRLLAHEARKAKADPATTLISDVVVVHNAALLSWQIGKDRGLMGLIRRFDRWWDAADIYNSSIFPISSIACWGPGTTAYPLSGAEWQSYGLYPTPSLLLGFGLPEELVVASAVHNKDVRQYAAAARATNRPGTIVKPSCMSNFYQFLRSQPIMPAGGSLLSSRSDTSGYEITLRYSANNAAAAAFHIPYARAPTEAEIIPYPATYHFVSNAVAYFDLTLDGSKPVTFAPGTTIDIWFPFVLDDTLRYDLTIGFADQPIGPIYSTPYDNVLHYTLPGFTITPGRTLMAEIDGNWPSPTP